MMTMRSFSSPGGRESRTVNLETEVKIVWQQWQHAVVLALLLAAVVQVVGVKNLGRLARLRLDGALVTRLELAAASGLAALAVAVPTLAACYNFLLNLYDGSQPMPRQAQPASDGPNAPGWLRWLGGWREQRPDPPAPPESHDYPGRAPSVPDPAQTEVQVNALLGTPQQARPVHIKLPLADWQRLSRYVARGGRSVSEADLVSGGFSAGPHGRARAVNRAFKAYQGATTAGDQGKPVIAPALADWIAARGYATDAAFPALSPSPVRPSV